MTRRFADIAGDAYPASQPQSENDRRPKVQQMPARPDYTQVEPSSEPVEYQWVVVGKDQVMIHPTATHDLMLEMSQHGHFSRPHAKGTLHLFDNWEAHFELLSSNMNLDLVRKALKKAAKQHGWDFKGLIDEDGLPHSEKIAGVPEDYRGQHQPGDEGAPLHDLTVGGVYPPTVYQDPLDWYHCDDETARVVRNAMGNPNVRVTVYRGIAPIWGRVPDHEDTINTGDWVTLSRKYASDHALGAGPPGEEYTQGPVLSAEVRAGDLRSEGSLMEWGYFGAPLSNVHVSSKIAADFGNGPINPGVKDYRNKEWAGTDQWDQMPPPGWDDSPDESHPSHGPYECSECGEHFPDYGAWRQHVSDMHTSVPSRDEDAKPLINNDATFPPKLMDWSRVQDQAGVVAGWREAGMTRKKLLEYKDQLDDRLGKPTDEVVHQFDDGWTIRKPLREGDLAHAGCLMGNCMKNLTMESGYADTPINEPSIHTLNDPEGLPHVMWNYTPRYAVEDTEGRHGAPVKDAYKPYLTEWGKQEGVNGFYEIDGQPIYTKDERVTPELDEAGDNEMVDLIEHKYPESEQSERAHDEYMRGIADEHFRDQHEIHNSIAGTHDQDGKTYHYTSDGHVFMREPAAGQQGADRYPEGLMYMPAHQYPSEMYHTMADGGVLPDRLRRNIDISRDSGLFTYDPSNKLHRLYMQQAGELNLTPEESQSAQQMRQNGLDEAQIKSVIETLRARQDRLASEWTYNA